MANNEESWLRDMNSLTNSDLIKEGDLMDIAESEMGTVAHSLTAEAYERYVESLQGPQWVVYTRPDALYSRLGIQLECYPLARSTPSAYENLLNQVSVKLISLIIIGK